MFLPKIKAFEEVRGKLPYYHLEITNQAPHTKNRNRHSNRRKNRREQTDDEAIRIVSNVKGLKINNGKAIVWVPSGIWAMKRKIMAFTSLSVTL